MASITERTISACNGLQISALPQDWTDQAWSSDFCESSELPEVLENRLVDGKYFVDELQSLLLIARQWSAGGNDGRLNEGKLNISWLFGALFEFSKFSLSNKERF